MESDLWQLQSVCLQNSRIGRLTIAFGGRNVLVRIIWVCMTAYEEATEKRTDEEGDMHRV